MGPWVSLCRRLGLLRKRRRGRGSQEGRPRQLDSVAGVLTDEKAQGCASKGTGVRGHRSQPPLLPSN